MPDDLQSQAPSQASPSQASKEPYEAPTLKRLGSITELTRGNSVPDRDDFTLAGSL
jgi:hypothetical protein